MHGNDQANPPECLSADQKRHHHFRQIERFLKSELRRFDLSHRQQTLAEVLVELSYGWANKSVRIPKLDMFEEMTGINRANTHRALQDLHTRRILTVEIKDGVPEYTINPNPETWQAAPRLARVRIRNAKELLKSYNGQADELDPSSAAARKALAAELNLSGHGNGSAPVNFKDDGGADIFASGVLSLATVVSTQKMDLFPHIA
jgi:phage replication O-like protein O